MFKRSFTSSQGTKDRVSKVSKQQPKRSFREETKQRMLEKLESPRSVGSGSPKLTSAIITVVIGRDQRLFAAHEDVLCHSPFFQAALQGQFLDASPNKRIILPDEEPEIFSCVLEYLYKGDYTPRLLHDKRRGSWMLEGAEVVPSTQTTPDLNNPQNNTNGGRGGGNAEGMQQGASNSMATMFHAGEGAVLLRDTVVYCAAERYGLAELKRLALRKQGLQSGIDVGTVLRSARYAYAHTPDTDSRLRAHYLALIIRSRRTFKRSGTMQQEMEMGGKMFFDLFVAMCNHIDDIVDIGNAKSPKSII
ncbi:btb poz-like protein [Diplodia corticola]|uniref:Btb poz-like protein n=1 Tax=Diplodia corticola TaxID=236234 RepID=A0A1J9RHQ5_9PEZI|nr:btb poz-like protein [Diplodia corticola]OJD39961.1 btb poz-like protein [Diplodia corticola]